MLLLLLAMAGTETDESLVKRCKRGDQAAFATLVSRYQDRIYSQCLRWIGDPRIAEEVTQDVFLAIHRAIPRFRGEARFSTWIFRITINHCKNRRLYRKRRKTDQHTTISHSEEEEGRAPIQIPDTGPGTDRGRQQSEAEQILYTALDALEESQRHIILLRDIQDLSYDEIANILDLPRGTVKSRLHRARMELAKVVSRTHSESDIFD